MLQCNVPSWEYGKPLKQRLLPAHLRRLTHEDSAQLTNWRYRHRSGLYPSESGDGSRCQRPVLCSHRWMTGTRLVRWMRWERPVSPRLQRRATIDPLSILCPSRGGSTSPERHLDSSFPLQLEPGGKQQRWSVGHRPVAFGGLWQVPRCSPNSLFADTTVIGLRRGRDLRGRGRLGWARLHWRVDCLRWRDVALARRRHLRGRSPRASTGGWAALQIDLWQRAASPARLRHSPHDGRDAIHKKALAGPGTAQPHPDRHDERARTGRRHHEVRLAPWTVLRSCITSPSTLNDWPDSRSARARRLA